MNWLKIVALCVMPTPGIAQEAYSNVDIIEHNGRYISGEMSFACPSVGVLADSDNSELSPSGLVVGADENGVLTLEVPIPEGCDSGGVYYVKFRLWATLIEPEVLEFVALNRRISCSGIYRQDDVVVANCRLNAPIFSMDYSTPEFPRERSWPTVRGDLFYLTNLADALATLGLASRECSAQEWQEFNERAPSTVNVHWMRSANCDELEIVE